MQDPRTRAEWQELLREDIDAIKEANILPRAIALRLEEAHNGNFGSGWRGFSTRGRGISSIGREHGAIRLVLEFRSLPPAQETLHQLLALKNTLKLVVGIECRTFSKRGNKLGGLVLLKLIDIPQDAAS